MSDISMLYNKFSFFPGGKWLFTKFIGFKVPYFSYTIKPIIIELRPGISVIKMHHRRSILGHMEPIHPIGVSSLCELTFGIASKATVPDNLRCIPRNMNVQYLQEPYGTLTATCIFELKNLLQKEFYVPVFVTDQSGVEVIKAEICLHITHKFPPGREIISI